MDIDKKTIEKILGLSRMDISDDEKNELLNDLNVILEYINQLEKVDTDNIDIDLEKSKNSSLREDEEWIRNQLDIDLLISGFRDRVDGKLRVPSVFEKRNG